MISLSITKCNLTQTVHANELGIIISSIGNRNNCPPNTLNLLKMIALMIVVADKQEKIVDPQKSRKMDQQ